MKSVMRQSNARLIFRAHMVTVNVHWHIIFYSFLNTRNVLSMELTFSEHGRRNSYMFMDFTEKNYASS